MTGHKLVHGPTKRRMLAMAAAASLVVGTLGLLAPAASADVTTVTGSAYGVKGAISLFGGPPMLYGPTPQVTLPAGGSATPVTSSVGSLQMSFGPAVFFRSGAATVTTQGTPGATGSVTSSTSFGPTAGNANTPCPFSYATSFTAASPIVTSATANFTAADLGKVAYSGFLPANNPHPNSEQKATILAVLSTTQATLSVNATGSGSGYLTIDRNVGSCIYNSAFTANTATTSCTANEAGTTASTHFTNGLLVTETDDYQDPTIVVAIPDDPLPNTTIDGFFWLNGATKESFTYVLNEQTTNPDGSLTVNAAHLTAKGETAYGDTYFGSSTCGATSTNAPVAVGDTSSAIEDTPLSVAAPGVLANDTDPGGNALTAVKVSDPAHGSVALNTDGSYTYTPNANFHGNDSFSYKANNGTRSSNAATVNITVSAVNDTPVAADDSAATSQNSPITVAAPGVLGNDTDVDGDTLTAAKVTDPANGTATVNADGSYTYTPNAGFIGTDTFTYKANDGNADSNVATVTITVDSFVPATLSVGDVSLNEGNAATTAATFTVTRSGDASGTSTVKVATTNGTATAASADYNAVLSSTVTFGPGDTTKTVTAQVNGDTVPEADETFNLMLSRPTGATITDNKGVATIVNDDTVPTLSVGDVSVNEGDSGTTNADFTVTRSNNTTGSSTVKYKTVNGTATTVNHDYTAIATKTLTFAPNETSKTVTVSVTGDVNFEPDETFSLVLSSPTVATINDDTGVGTIVNDDAQPHLSVAAPAPTNEGNTGTTPFTFTITRSNNTQGTTTVKWKTASGTALSSDFTTVPNTVVTFNPGESTKTVTVNVKGDTLVESDETFSVVLSTPTGGADITTATADATILNDD